MADLKLAVLILFLCIQISLSAKPCSTAANCRYDQCCVSINQPRGRRSLTRAISKGKNLPGTCQPMGGNGDPCYVKRGSSATRPSDLTYSCPCKSPLRCVGSGIIEVPLGETGTCRSGHYKGN